MCSHINFSIAVFTNLIFSVLTFSIKAFRRIAFSSTKSHSVLRYIHNHLATGTVSLWYNPQHMNRKKRVCISNEAHIFYTGKKPSSFWIFHPCSYASLLVLYNWCRKNKHELWALATVTTRSACSWMSFFQSIIWADASCISRSDAGCS